MAVKKTTKSNSKTVSKLSAKKSATRPAVTAIPESNLVSNSLNTWFKQHARILPWRENPTPYFVWISEIMLQQTQVTTVIPYFERFITRFPTVKDLAKAPIEEVYKLWAGLGYYSRARNLHKGAEHIHQNGFPKVQAEWLAVPGVGNYTAGAVCSIALNQREAIVDGNVVRVLSRVYKIGYQKNGEAIRDAKFTAIWEKARELVAVKSVEPRSLNQSLMELGALVCKPKNPQCEICPIQKFCLGQNEWEKYPAPKAKKIWKPVQESKWILTRGTGTRVEVYLEENSNTGWRKGLWDFPNSGSVPSLQKGNFNVKLTDQFLLNYVVTNHKVSRQHQVFHVKSSDDEKTSKMAGKWYKLEELPGVPSPVAKALKKLNELSLSKN
jgi:A/G-specific adenine glycosylase